jgi:hypothetical protein
VCVNFKLTEVEPYNSVYSSGTILAYMLLGIDGDLCGGSFLTIQIFPFKKPSN